MRSATARVGTAMGRWITVPLWISRFGCATIATPSACTARDKGRSGTAGARWSMPPPTGPRRRSPLSAVRRSLSRPRFDIFVSARPRHYMEFLSPMSLSSEPLFWDRCLAAFREQLTPQQFNTWIRPLAVQTAQGGYRVLAPNRFVLQWVRERFLGQIAQFAEQAEGAAVAISLHIAEPATEARREHADASPKPPRADPNALDGV